MLHTLGVFSNYTVMKKFEYKTLELKLGGVFASTPFKADEWEDELNALGEQGWELVTRIERNREGYTTRALLVFKREVDTSGDMFG